MEVGNCQLIGSFPGSISVNLQTKKNYDIITVVIKDKIRQNKMCVFHKRVVRRS